MTRHVALVGYLVALGVAVLSTTPEALFANTVRWASWLLGDGVVVWIGDLHVFLPGYVLALGLAALSTWVWIRAGRSEDMGKPTTNADMNALLRGEVHKMRRRRRIREWLDRWRP